MKLKTKCVYVFNRLLRYIPKLNILSTEESTNYLINSESSLARYGDGELNIMMGGDIHFQKYDEELAKRLRFILTEKQNHIKIGIPLAINYTGDYKCEVKEFWDMNMSTGRMHWYKLCSSKINYLNASMTRCYIDYKNKEKSSFWFSQFFNLWKDKTLLIIEGESSKLGVNNDLFKSAKSINRLICPSENAYGLYDKILNKAKEIAFKYDIVLVSLGPTATVLCYDLSKLNVRSIDIGHLNLEYNKYISDMNIKCSEMDKVDKIQYENQIVDYIR